MDCASVLRALLFLYLSQGIAGWGYKGHYILCRVAKNYFSEETKAAVRELYQDSPDSEFAYQCSWGDTIKGQSAYTWTKKLHFANTPDFMCNYDYRRDCHDSHGVKNRCVAGAIYNYTMQLESAYNGSKLESKYNLTEALLFLSHFVGDVHQPLHCGFRGDAGGNSIKVQWYGKKTNLHSVWDTQIIQTALEKYYSKKTSNMAKAIISNITDVWSKEKIRWETCADNSTVCPNPYASESISLACKHAYKNATPGSTLGDDYFYSRLPVIQKRLGQGGVRLAAVLNRIFGSTAKIASI